MCNKKKKHARESNCLCVYVSCLLINVTINIKFYSVISEWKSELSVCSHRLNLKWLKLPSYLLNSVLFMRILKFIWLVLIQCITEYKTNGIPCLASLLVFFKQKIFIINLILFWIRQSLLVFFNKKYSLLI